MGQVAAVEPAAHANGAAAPPSERLWKPSHNKWAVALTVTMATFMEILDTSIANVALPNIAGGLSAGVDESTWVLTSYLVSNAIVLPVSGWVIGWTGRKRFYMACVAIFTISSFLCGLAPTLGTLVLLRVIQGAGGGGLQPSEQSILADTFEPAERAMAFSIYGMAVVLAPAIGPTLGGYITDHFNWRWIFFINVPVGILSLLFSYRVVEDPPYLKEEMKRFASAGIDYVGLGLVAVGLGFLQVMLDKGQREDWFQSPFIITATVISAVALIAFVIWELGQEQPVADLRLFRNRTYVASNIAMFVVGIALYGTTVLLPQYVELLLGYSAQQSGMVLTPGGFTIMILMPIVGLLMARVDARMLIAFGFIVMALALYHMTSLNLQTDYRTAMMYRVYQSAGLAFLFMPISMMAYVGLPQEKNNMVAGMVNLARNIGGSVGISMVETVIGRRSQFHQDVLSTHISAYEPAARSATRDLGVLLFHSGIGRPAMLGQGVGRIYGSVLKQATALAFVDAVWLTAVLCACMVPLVFLMKKNDLFAMPVAGH
ncbi:MAG TPA: DHA2 family efflux MFS transporter permease subunit [Candidatus Binataceae bacterium]|nr:DHA2 family efflux MFS transporter permease subunit [Candidatus Binataceae bacterium]